MLDYLRLRLQLWLARSTRAGLRRERARLHIERNGIEWALRRNEVEAQTWEREIARLQVQLACRRAARARPARSEA